jgi:predicted nucleic acid-binding protein
VKVLADTSVLVAAMVESHPDHEQAFPWLRAAKQGQHTLFVATHTLAETYAVLTSLPLQPRIGPDVARRLIRENVERQAVTVELRRADYRRVLDDMASLGLSGGVVYDALAAHAAQKAGVDRLLTLNPGDFRRVWPDGAAAIAQPQTAVLPAERPTAPRRGRCGR